MSKTVLAVRQAVLALGWALVAAAQVGAEPVTFRAPSDTPAVSRAAAAQGTFLALAQAGPRLVAAGLRGRIVYSDDGGKSWKQARVPVEVDLVALSFASPSEGWAVGHRGVVLSSSDGGATWTRRFAEQQLNELIVRYYQALGVAADSPGGIAASGAARSLEDGSTVSVLDVWFESASTGYLVGTFNLLLRTEDGGKSWMPMMDRIDNPEELHFYALRGQGSGLYLAGEKGSVWRLDTASQRWLAVPTGYAGTLFGLVADGPRVLAYGMRGRIYHSADGGRQWQPVDWAGKAGIVSGVQIKPGELVLADQAGELLRSQDGGQSFALLPSKSRIPAFALLQSSAGTLWMAGPSGVSRVDIP